MKKMLLQICFLVGLGASFVDVAAMQQEPIIQFDSSKIEVKPSYSFFDGMFIFQTKKRQDFLANTDELTIDVSEESAEPGHFILAKMEFTLLLRKEVDRISISTKNLHFTRYFLQGTEPKAINAKTDLGFLIEAKKFGSSFGSWRNPNKQIIWRCLAQILGMLLIAETGNDEEAIRCAVCEKYILHEKGASDFCDGHYRTRTGLLYCVDCVDSINVQPGIAIAPFTDNNSLRRTIATAMEIVNKAGGGFCVDRNMLLEIQKGPPFGGDLLLDKRFDELFNDE